MAEHELLLEVYEAARAVLRYYGVDLDRYIDALDRLDAATEAVRHYQQDPKDEETLPPQLDLFADDHDSARRLSR